MTQTNLRSVALKTVANYRQAAEHAVGAYRVGGHRLLSVITRRLNQAAARSAGRFAPRLAAALQRANSNVGSVAGKGLDMVSTGTERVIELSSAGVTAQVSRVAKLAGGVENSMVANGLDAVARISLPSAQMALTLSQKIADGADKLETVAAGQPAVKAKAKAKAQAKTRRQPAPRSAAAGRTGTRKAAKPTAKATEKNVVDEAAKVVRAVKRGVADVQAETVSAGKRVSRSVKRAVANAPAPEVAAAQVRRRAVKSAATSVSKAAQSVQDAADKAAANA